MSDRTVILSKPPKPISAMTDDELNAYLGPLFDAIKGSVDDEGAEDDEGIEED